MTIDTRGYVSVVEAARRLDLSIEQIRRKLRDGKLKGRRVGNQWFVQEEQLGDNRADAPLIPPETLERISRLREEANRYNASRGGKPFDAVEMLRRSRGED